MVFWLFGFDFCDLDVCLGCWVLLLGVEWCLVVFWILFDLRFAACDCVMVVGVVSVWCV